MDNHFKIIIPLYNVEKWIKVCLMSVKKQNYKNFECIVVDDISTDNSVKIIKQIIKDDDRFRLVVNKEKKYALKNIYEAILLSEPKDEDIIVTLDGDDWLAGKDVLSTLNQVYNEKGCWLTYGSYAEYPSKSRGKFAKRIPNPVIQQNQFREYEWCSSHLRTFKHHLWKQIKKEDLLDTNGQFYRMTWDLAFMFPMLEMSGNKSEYIDKILYVYNLGNPLNDHKVDNGYQIILERQIRGKEKYKRLKE
jgi:glycosyltransferase involved in cell wall biosynthesis